MVVTVRIDVLSRRARRAKAAAQELASVLARDTEASIETDYDSTVPRLSVYFYLHTPTKPIAATIIATAARHPKATIRVRQGLDVEITGEASEEQSRLLSELLGERTD